jgi:hypothetical protein
MGIYCCTAFRWFTYACGKVQAKAGKSRDVRWIRAILITESFYEPGSNFQQKWQFTPEF